MGFFKRLKDRLFTLNYDSDEEKKEKKAKKELKHKEVKPKDTFPLDEKLQKEVKFFNSDQEALNDSIDEKDIAKNAVQIEKEYEELIDKKEQKILQKEEKKLLKRLAKENKINKFVAGLEKSGSNLSQKIKELQNRYNKIDENFFEELEEILIMADISTNLVMTIIYEIKKSVKTENITDPKLIGEIIADKLFVIYANNSFVDTTMKIEKGRLNVILMVGINGSGKTTTIAKLSSIYKEEGFKILVAAGDTFRAGAVDQLEVWTQRVGVDIVKPQKEGQDPSSVVFVALEKAQKEKYDLLIIDTAGRLQNKVNLMNELSKINKTIARFIPEAPHESLLVLDATNGQNALNQAQSFKEVTPITGIVLTKMDGTSKGGIVISIKDQMNVDVKFIGLGEKIHDLQEFDLDAYIYGLTKDMIVEKYNAK